MCVRTSRRQNHGGKGGSQPPGTVLAKIGILFGRNLCSAEFVAALPPLISRGPGLGACMEYRILGPLEVRRGDSPLPVGGPRHRKLLAVLLLHAGDMVSAEHLIGALWGNEPPASAAAMLHVRISEVRAALRGVGADVGLVTQSGGYRLDLDDEALDSRRFERMAEAGGRALARGDHSTASTQLRTALALWRGSPFAELADDLFAQGEIARLEALRLQALESRLEADLALGRHGHLVAELEALVAEHPLRERFWSQLMLAYYRAGRQGDALLTYQAVRELLVERLGVEPGAELRRLQAAVLAQDRGLELAAADRTEPPGNLPSPIATFIGRDWDLAAIRELSRRSRLITLVGVGGAGKSRLALEVARASRAEFPDGTWLVELAPLTQPGLVVQTVASALGVREHPGRPLADLLADHLKSAKALLVFDNCEHLLDEVAELAQQLLRSGPRLSILATSRERLGITGELLRPVSGLAVPGPEADQPGEVAAAEAAKLLIERATAIQPGFRLDLSTAAAVAQICRELDGLPLAIELAAARVSALDVNQIATRLQDRFRLLTTGERTALPRHRTLRAVTDWSYELLSLPERRMFDRAAVFIGGFTIEAAEAVCAEPGDEPVPSLLARLVDKSLLVGEHRAPGGRLHMLETLRMYGLERLGDHVDAARVRDRHADYFLSLAEAAREEVRGPELATWVSRMEVEHGNFRAALQWSLDQGATEQAARLAGSMYPLWDLHGYYSEGRGWLTRVLEADGELPAGVRARALLGSATLAVIQADLEHAAAACQEAAQLCEQAGDPAGLAHALQYLGLGALFADDPATAAALLQQSLGNARLAGDGWLEAWAIVFLAAAALARGAYADAAELAADSVAVQARAHDPEFVAWAFTTQAMARLAVGDHPAALAPLRAALEGFRGLGALWGLSLALFVRSQVAEKRGNQLDQVMFLGAAEHLRTSVGAGQFPFVGAWVDATVAQGRAALGDAAFDRAWRAGQELSPEAATAEALRELDAAATPPSPSGSLLPPS
jgi:predicted ATPase/DNA-binding SARP family transcriptional activator